MHTSDMQRSGDIWSDCLIVCPPPQYSITEQWRMVVIVTRYTLFVSSQYDVIFTFADQRFGKFVNTTCVLFYMHSPCLLLYNVSL